MNLSLRILGVIVLSVSFLLVTVVSHAKPSGDKKSGDKTNGKKEVCFEFNQDTVASAVLKPMSSGYGIIIVLTDKGWYTIRQIDASPGNKILFKVNGQVITEETPIGSAFPKEFIWTRQTGVNDFTKEEAETLIKGITKTLKVESGCSAADEIIDQIKKDVPDNEIAKLSNTDLKSRENPEIALDSNDIPQSNTTMSTYTGSDYRGNYVYGGAMNLAWNELNENILHEKLRLNTTDKKALEMVDKFNKAIFTKNDLDEASYYVKSGYGQKTVDIINKESRAKFPDKSFDDLQLQLNDKDIIAYAYFLKKVEYETPFVIANVSFMGESVRGFLANTMEQKEKVEVIKYWDDNKFIIRLQLKDDNDELILAKGFDMFNPKDVVDEIRKYDTQNFPTIDDNDLFKMPKLHLDHHYDYNEIIGKCLLNKGFELYCIEVMYENIKFDMDEKGARVENEAVIAVKPKLLSGPEGKSFILDKPFWVVMKRKNSRNPYFILGVNNTELMEKNYKIAATSGSNDNNTSLTPMNNTQNNPESQTGKKKQPQEAAVPNLKITVLEEKKKEKVPVEGAGVYLDNKEIGTTDKSGELFIKETIENYHILEVKKSGYFTFKENIEISEYAEDKTVILNPGITDSEEDDNEEDEDVQETQEQVTETPQQTPEAPEQDVVLWKVSVLKDAGKKKLPVKGAEIFLDDLPFGETDNEGILKKAVKIGKHTLKVECDKFHPFVKEIEISKDADFTEIVLKRLLSEGKKVPEQQNEKATEQQTDKKTQKPILKISVLGDTGLERVPVKGAKILINGYLCGVTDKDGLFSKRERIGEHKLKVEKNGFYPVVQKIKFNEHSDSYEIVLKKMSGKR